MIENSVVLQTVTSTVARARCGFSHKRCAWVTRNQTVRGLPETKRV